MTPLCWNAIKVVLGFLVGIPLLVLLAPLPIPAISGIQCVFFTLFYTSCDLLRDRLRGKEEEAR